MGEIVIAPMVDKRAKERADRLRRAYVGGLKEALGLLRELAGEYAENGYNGREDTIRTGMALVSARIAQLEKGNANG